MKKVVITVLSLVGAAILLTMILIVYSTTTPKYALLQTAKDIERYGYSGLEMHLTESAREAIDIIPDASEFVEEGSLGSVLGIFSNGVKDTGMGWLKSKLSECQWSLVSVTQSGSEAEATLHFNYENVVIGTIPITMLHENGEWKIDSVGIPTAEKLDVSGIFGD